VINDKRLFQYQLSEQKLVFYKKYLNEKCEIHHVILGGFLSPPRCLRAEYV